MAHVEHAQVASYMPAARNHIVNAQNTGLGFPARLVEIQKAFQRCSDAQNDLLQ